MKLNRMLTVCGLAAALTLSAGTLSAQEEGGGRRGGGGGGGGEGRRDPAQFQQRIMENLRERLGFTNDTEWAAVQPLVQRVFDARREIGFQGMGFGRGGRGGGGGGGFRGGEQSPEQTALQNAVESNAPAAQIKAALERYREARKAKEEKLAKAQEDLRKVLSTKQEAEAVLAGLLN